MVNLYSFIKDKLIVNFNKKFDFIIIGLYNFTSASYAKLYYTLNFDKLT